MILFKEEHVAPILAGTKTQTRRIWKKPRAKIGAIHLAKTKMISKEFFAKLEILEVYQERLLSISDEDAKAEGYENATKYAHRIWKDKKGGDGSMIGSISMPEWSTIDVLLESHRTKDTKLKRTFLLIALIGESK
jgi:hypothetical protein